MPAAQTRALLRKLAYTPSQDGKAADFLHDNAEQCTNCRGWFCASDMHREEDPWAEDRGECWFCRWNLAPSARALLLAEEAGDRHLGEAA